MRVIEEGHRYALMAFNGDGESVLQFQQKARFNPGKPDVAGTNNQEVLRALIDRVRFLDGQCPHRVNSEIVYHLRMALVLHEARALERKAGKGELSPESVAFDDKDGHFVLARLGSAE